MGNPPWVRPDWDEPASLAEFDPWWGVTDLKERRTRSCGSPFSRTPRYAAANAVANDRAEIEAVSALLSAPSREPVLKGIRTNLYMVFMTNVWMRSNDRGVVGLIHPEGHLVDPNGGPFRAETYSRLRKHWHFSNAMKLFPDVGDRRQFSVNVYGNPKSVKFLQAVGLLSTTTLDQSIGHSGEGELPGIQFPEGGFDLRPHRSRIVTIDEDVLTQWVLLFDEPGTPARESKLVRPLTTADLGAINVFAGQPTRLASLTRYWTAGFNEKNQKDDGTFEWNTEIPASLEDCILQGPHVLNAMPFGQQPRPICKSNNDWDPVDLTTISDDFIPRTNYRRLVSKTAFLERQTYWKGRPFTSYFREAHREFVESGTSRVLQSCLLPPGVSHIGKINSIFVVDESTTIRWTGLLSSLPYDYLIKVSGVNGVKKNITDGFGYQRRTQSSTRRFVFGHCD